MTTFDDAMFTLRSRARAYRSFGLCLLAAWTIGHAVACSDSAAEAAAGTTGGDSLTA